MSNRTCHTCANRWKTIDDTPCRTCLGEDGLPHWQAACTVVPAQAGPNVFHTELALLSWNGFNVQGDRASIAEVKRLVEFESARRIK